MSAATHLSLGVQEAARPGPRNLTLATALAGIFAVAALPAPALGADWGGGDGNWSDSSQWVPSSVPDSTTDIHVENGTAHIGSGTVNSHNAIIDAGGGVEVSGSGATWDNSGSSPGYGQRGGAIIVGETGVGTLDVSNGGTVKTTGTPAGTLLIGNQAGSNGTVTVGGGTGTSTLENSGPSGYPGQLYIGYAGTGALNVDAGGVVSGFQNVTLGVESTADGTLTVDGGSVDFGTSFIKVGDKGQGTLAIKNGGTVASASGFIASASSASTTGRGTVAVTGTGSTWTVGSGGLKIGADGAGALSIDDHGAVISGGSFSLASGTGSGKVTIQGGRYF
jgi:T5SS/PEP-CTERM-associated repeat protein